MRKERVLREAGFTPNVVRYYVLASAAGLAVTVVGIPVIVGIVDTDGFRDLVLEQRDRIAHGDDAPPAVGEVGPAPTIGSSSGDPALMATVIEIRDLLKRIEGAVSRTEEQG